MGLESGDKVPPTLCVGVNICEAPARLCLLEQIDSSL